VGSLAEIMSPTIALTAEYLNMQVKARPDSQRKQSIRRKMIVSTRKEPVQSLPNGQVPSINKGEKCVAIASRNVERRVAEQSPSPSLLDLSPNLD
jgi:hypothetical protein